MRYKSFFREFREAYADVQTVKNEIEQLHKQLDGFQAELKTTQTLELRNDIEQKITYVQNQIYELEQQLRKMNDSQSPQEG